MCKAETEASLAAPGISNCVYKIHNEIYTKIDYLVGLCVCVRCVWTTRGELVKQCRITICSANCVMIIHDTAFGAKAMLLPVWRRPLIILFVYVLKCLPQCIATDLCRARWMWACVCVWVIRSESSILNVQCWWCCWWCQRCRLLIRSGLLADIWPRRYAYDMRGMSNMLELWLCFGPLPEARWWVRAQMGLRVNGDSATPIWSHRHVSIMTFPISKTNSDTRWMRIHHIQLG